MPPKKRKVASGSNDASSTENTTKKSCNKGSMEDASNKNRGLLKLPPELWQRVFANYRSTDLTIDEICYANHSGDHPILPAEYLEKSDILRSLSQVCVAYRRNFLPFFWHDLMACIETRPGSGASPKMFFRHAAETMVSKCEGLRRNTELAAMVRCAKLVLTRYQSATIIPTLSSTLTSLSNIHTLQVVHAHPQMTTAFKKGFEGVTLPQIRKLVIPGFCHEILKSCPNARTVWCTEEDGSKLITVIQKHCPLVAEIRGIRLEKGKFKRIVKAVPNLEVIELRDVDELLSHLPQFKKFRRLIIKTQMSEGHLDEANFKPALDALVKTSVEALKKLPITKGAQKPSLCVLHVKTTRSRAGEEPPEVHCTEVDLHL